MSIAVHDDIVFMFLDARDPGNQRSENHSVYRGILDALGHCLMMELSLLCNCICGSDFECHLITDLYAGHGNDGAYETILGTSETYISSIADESFTTV